MSEEKIPRRTILSIYLIALAGNIAWAVENQYYNVFLYNEIAPVPLYVSLMVLITAFVSTFTTIIMGAISDVKGKRKFFMVYSFICWAITTALFPFAAFVRPVLIAVFVAILFDSIMTYFGATAYDACFNAYVTDVTTLENRGKAVGIMEIMVLIATLLIYASAGFIIVAIGYYAFFIIIGVLTGLIGLAGALVAKDAEKLKPLKISFWAHLRSTFQRDIIKQNSDFFLLMIGLAIWSIGFNVYFPFIIVYLQHYIGLPLELASIVMFFALMVSIILGIPIGILIDKVGRKRIAIVSVILESIALVWFAFSTEFILLVISGISWVLLMTMWHISSQTWIKDLYPEEKYGQFSGYYLLFNVLIGMSIGPLIGGYISSIYGESITIDGIPGNVPPPLIFIVGAIIIIFAIIPLLKAKELEKKRKD